MPRTNYRALIGNSAMILGGIGTGMALGIVIETQSWPETALMAAGGLWIIANGVYLREWARGPERWE